ncbi:M20/M25/M40 family metallo-hydrolase [Companilactobacillus bobalius]|uniref:Succinyl-diaminopimelate desuccinylase n=2 Tax=Companilactobacillus bobalius TaxID=2801451 RepID=A0A202FF31_9LACO|nr:M20/M25/M40 family metallo-hydrolase [Companilactobacillus bobalius]KRK83252.1 succinyl-diaminopimelate desuccinylase [Companilactobacillus bobalius DSM 19674]OVE99058.1 Succinyl-diaminopimelate desuccinylase [Companilactobacillus bobalius]GEO57033.1 succinyl-diaminopimelate desuccinylase [Companilactobacillus paralimentarius]
MDKAQRLSVLDDLIKLETVNDREEIVANYLKDLFEKHGINVELNKYADNRYNLIATIKNNDGPILGFTGHEDVVATVDDSKWNYGPFNPKHIDGKIFGRGSSDMKSGLAGLAIALIELNDDPNFNGNIKFIATVGEEVGEIGSEKLAKEGYADDLNALVVGEPSNSSSRLVMEQLIDNGLVETNGAKPETRIAAFCAHKGSVTYKVVSHGKAAHSSMPEVGINALDNLITYYNKQAEYFKNLVVTEDDVLGTTKPSVTVMNAGKQENTIPDYAEMTVKIRTIPEYGNDKIISELKDMIDKMNQENPRMNLEFQLKSSNWPVKTDINSDFIQLVRDSYKDVLGVNILTVGAPGGTDASKFVQANHDLDVVVAGPGNESAHQINEFVFEDDYLQYIDIYKTLAEKYFA